MQKIYLSKTQSGIYGLFTNGFLVTQLTKTEHDDFLKCKSAYKQYCRQANFEPCDQAILDWEYFYGEEINLKKIYFTVKTFGNTYYFESDCNDSLKVDVMRVRYAPDVIASNIESITYSNQLPKGILI